MVLVLYSNTLGLFTELTKLVHLTIFFNGICKGKKENPQGRNDVPDMFKTIELRTSHNILFTCLLYFVG